MDITAEMVKELRARTSVGIMDCKNALSESNGDIDAAVGYLRKQGIAKAEKKSGRSANEGMIMSYIHPGSRLGVLLEINCETDFVARTDEFQVLCKEIAMQVAASNPIGIVREDIPSDIIEHEKEVYESHADLQGKPENIRQKISAGKLEKFYQQVCLMEQSYIKEPSKTVSDFLKESIGKLGENIAVRRFVRFQLGEDGA